MSLSLGHFKKKKGTLFLSVIISNQILDRMEYNKFSKVVTQDPTQPAAQAMLHAIGLTEEDFKKPLVGIASTLKRQRFCRKIFYFDHERNENYVPYVVETSWF